VLEVSRLTEGTTLVLQSGERVFLARMATPAAVPMGPVTENSWVRVTGVCVNNRLPRAAEQAGTVPRNVSFHLMLESPDAVHVIHTPSWWTLRRVLAAGGVLVAVTLVAFVWVVALRRRVTRQTALIREHLARETLYEERVRIARELHDSLEQDLLGITMQLNATEKLLTQPDRAKDALHLAAAMVRRSQAETHRAVWDLRDDRSNGDGMVGTLRDAVAGLTSGAGPRVELRVTGSPRALPPQIENHLLRVAMEAVTNAIKYASAARIDVELHFEADQIELRVADDGKGFDAEHLPAPSTGHFGLFGMRERAEKLKGKLSITSEPGKGTEIRLDAPLASSNGVVSDGNGRNGRAGVGV
jgi:signal transduction histidine kinase